MFNSSFFLSTQWLLSRVTKSKTLTYPPRSELPETLFEWRYLGLFGREEDPNYYTQLWGKLRPLFEQQGFTLFRWRDELNQSIDGLPAPSNYVYIPVNNVERACWIRNFSPMNSCLHAVQKNNRYYVVRVISAGGEGLDSLHILRLLSNTSPDRLYSNNHILPMVEEIVYQDITFGVFPLVFGKLKFVLNPYLTRSTLEDVLHLIMQAIEGIIYIHGKNIAHRDLFSDNFLLDFFPESLTGQCWTRPRVYLSDFETAVHFPDDVDLAERLVCGVPLQDIDINLYRRKAAPELLVSETNKYCPFRMDMFQFGCHLDQYLKSTGFEELDSLWPQLLCENPTDRLTPHELFDKLGDFIKSTPPKDLQRTWTYVAQPEA